MSYSVKREQPFNARQYHFPLSRIAGSLPRYEPLASVALIAAVSLLSFGVFVPSLGLYHDDYLNFVLLDRLDVAGVMAFGMQQARPIAPLLFALSGGSVWFAHALMLLVHTANGLLLLYLLRRLWRGQPLLTTLATVLFVVYPLYWMRPWVTLLIADFSLMLALLSFALIFAADELRGWRRTGVLALSLGMVPLYFFIYELPFGLEALRPLLFWRLSAQRAGDVRARLRWTAAHYAPWLFVLALLLFYRLVIYRASGIYAETGYNEPITLLSLDTLLQRLRGLAAMLGTQILMLPLLNPLQLLADRALTAGTAALGALTAAGVMLYVAFFGSFEVWGARSGLLRLAAFGLLLMALGQVPILASKHNLSYTALTSRWTLVSSLGAAVLWVALVTLAASVALPRRAALLAAVALSAAAATGTMGHAHNAQVYADDWRYQREFWWQLGWRVPAFADDTLIVIEHYYPTAYERGIFWYETTLAADFFFNNPRLAALPAYFVTLPPPERGFRFLWPDRDRLSLGVDRLEWPYRRENMVLAYLSEGCLELYDPEIGLVPGKTVSEWSAALLPELASPDRRVVQDGDSDLSTRARLLPEPEHGWCYYYQQAQLARSRQDWPLVYNLYQAVTERHLEPEVAAEWDVFDVFYEGALRAGAEHIPVRAQFEDGIALDGFDYLSGAPLLFRFYWRADAPPSAPYSLFLHLIREGDTIPVVQFNGAPARVNRPTHTWTDAAERIASGPIALALPADLAAGCYGLVAGLYDYISMERLGVLDAATGAPASDAVELLKICLPLD